MDTYDREEYKINRAARLNKDFLVDLLVSPCVKCDHRTELYCRYYKSNLEEVDGVIIPCYDCTADSYRNL